MTPSSKTVLITGCSTGIGRALAIEFHNRGLCVYASARNIDTLSDLAGLGMQTMTLDVNNPDDIKAAAEILEKERGGADILINNAGFIAIGPIAEIPIDRLRLQFETNVTSAVALAQAVLPPMVRKQSGCIVNIGSVSGILTTPFAGAYCASKSAIHSISDALRIELAPFNVKVITVQPGAISSNLGDTAKAGIPRNDTSIYASIYEALEKRAMASQAAPTPVDEFAATVADGVLSPEPPAIIRTGKQSRILPLIRYFLPTGMRDRLLSKKFSLNELG